MESSLNGEHIDWIVPEEFADEDCQYFPKEFLMELGACEKCLIKKGGE